MMLLSLLRIHSESPVYNSNKNSTEAKTSDDIKIDIINYINFFNNQTSLPLLLPAPKTKVRNYIMSNYIVIIHKNLLNQFLKMNGCKK